MGRDALREDVVRPTLPREDLLANAPQQSGGYVKVPVVLEMPDDDKDEA
jgi:Asp-tRNA(Asn)/Glu-tRNA(Gln) amidotransferase C subunit